MSLLCAMAMTPESGVMMRFWDCCALWWDRLWMLVRVLTGGSPPPDTEICQGATQKETSGTRRGLLPAPRRHPDTATPKNRDLGGWKKPLRAKQAAATLGTFQ